MRIVIQLLGLLVLSDFYLIAIKLNYSIDNTEIIRQLQPKNSINCLINSNLIFQRP